MNDYNLTNHSERIRQIVTLAQCPFTRSYDIRFNTTVAQYSFYGTEFATDCLTMYHYPDGNPGLGRRSWDYGILCSCPGLIHLQDHSNGDRYAYFAYNTASNPSNGFDNVGVVVGHSLCKTGNPHYAIFGCGCVGLPGFVISGGHGFITESNPERFYNILYTAFLLTHEISHNFGCNDGYNQTVICTENYPCIMNYGFPFMVYVANAWCDDCCSDLDPTVFD